MINIDTFLEIGDQHKVCEDYIVSGVDPVPYIILSDGCSTANNSEMGSRLLCHLAKQYLKYNADQVIDYWNLGHWVIYNAEQTIRQLGLSRTCLTATLIVAYQIEDNVRIMMYGDGSYITVAKSGIINITTVEYTNNAPYYLVYLIDQYREDLYHKAGNMKTVTTYYEDGSESKEEFAYDHALEYGVNTKVYPNLLIASDGIDSFLKKDGSSTIHLRAENIIHPCVAFKNMKGEFLKRRLNKQMKVYNKEGITHFDDLSVGAFIDEVVQWTLLM